VTIHSSDPFATPAPDRSPVRRMRGRLPAAVTLWTSGSDDADRGRAGLTVSSTLIADGAPPRVLALIDDESDLWAAIQRTERFAVQPLGEPDRQLADRFAGLMPAAGGLFALEPWTQTPWGPVLAQRATWLGARLEQARQVGWSLLVQAVVEHVEVDGGDWHPLVHYRGRYQVI
jgi:3-hydroxy-9,10-secoandrosta-1,3,5(10)-triene-9,17-dione monooxygenase reductase component